MALVTVIVFTLILSAAIFATIIAFHRKKIKQQGLLLVEKDESISILSLKIYELEMASGSGNVLLFPQDNKLNVMSPELQRLKEIQNMPENTNDQRLLKELSYMRWEREFREQMQQKLNEKL